MSSLESGWSGGTQRSSPQKKLTTSQSMAWAPSSANRS